MFNENKKAKNFKVSLFRENNKPYPQISMRKYYGNDEKGLHRAQVQNTKYLVSLKIKKNQL